MKKILIHSFPKECFRLCITGRKQKTIKKAGNYMDTLTFTLSLQEVDE